MPFAGWYRHFAIVFGGNRSTVNETYFWMEINGLGEQCTHSGLGTRTHGNDLWFQWFNVLLIILNNTHTIWICDHVVVNLRNSLFPIIRFSYFVFFVVGEKIRSEFINKMLPYNLQFKLPTNQGNDCSSLQNITNDIEPSTVNSPKTDNHVSCNRVVRVVI